MEKKEKLSLEELLEQALVKDEDKPYEVPGNWIWTKLMAGFARCLDNYRKPINAEERASKEGDIPYYGATGQVGWIDDYLTNDNLVLVGEDGAPFFDFIKDKAYIIDGKAWVNNHAHILKSYYGVCGNKFLMHFLNCFDYHGYANGTTRLKLTQGSMNNIPIPLPPLPEQQRIVNLIEPLFEKLECAKELVQNSLGSFENRKSAILHKAFTGELTAKWREENRVDFERDWEERKLNDVCSIITDGTHQTPTYADDGYIFLSSKNVTSGKIDWDNIKYIPQELHEKLYSRLTPQLNDILLAKNGTTGVAAVVDRDCVFDIYVSLALLRPKGIILPYYLLYAINNPKTKEKFNQELTGIGVPNLHLRNIRETTIPIPLLSEQQEIVCILDSLLENEQKAKELCNVIDKIDFMKKSILARAFRGELSTNSPNEESALELLKEVLREKAEG